MPAGLSDSEQAERVARIAREARTAARLHHPGVVTIHDVVEHDGAPWIVMEFIDGRSLGAELAASGGQLTWERVADIGANVADSLAAAHARGIVHRDLKPDNILLAGARVVVTDFGIASVADSTTKLTATGTVLGTPQYMAPEQWDGARVGPAADMWSLGATLYAATEGKPPFDGPTLPTIIAAVLNKEPAPPRFAGHLAPVLAQLLAKAPDVRPSARTAAQALRAAAAPHLATVTAAAPLPATVTAVTTPSGRQAREYHDPSPNYRHIPRRGWHQTAFLATILLCISFVGIPLAILLPFFIRNRAVRMNVILALEITVFGGLSLALTLLGTNGVPPSIFFMVVGSVGLAAYAVMIVFCIVQIGRHRQPVIPVLTRSVHRLAYRKTEAPWPPRGRKTTR